MWQRFYQRLNFIPVIICCLLIAKSFGADDGTVYYWNGDQKVTVDLALDEMVVTATNKVLLEKKADGSFAANVPKSSKVIIKSNAQNKSDLIQTAEKLQAQDGILSVHAALYSSDQEKNSNSIQVLSNQLSIRFQPTQNAAALIAAYNLVIVEVVTYSPDTYICALQKSSLLGALETANALYEKEGVVFATPLIERVQLQRGNPDDPLFGDQWFLNSINVPSVWDFSGGGSNLGAGVNVAVVDDSLEHTHPDLTANARTDIDIDINGGDNDPAPGSNADVHGTWVGGIIAGNGNNSVGVSGVAPRASLVGIRLIAGAVTDANEAQAMTHQYNAGNAADRIMVSNNSWGPSDNGSTLGLPGPLMLAALQNGVTNGRGGLGIIYTWAGGNGGTGDIANFDGYASSRYVIGVAATGPTGQQASYSESGTNILVNAPGGTTGSNGIVTTDRVGALGQSGGDYTALSDNLQGTSFSAPVVAGVVALMLEKNPNLTSRDVRHALVKTATKNHPGDAGWVTNGASRPFNLKYGFGRVDAAAAVAAVAVGTWQHVPAETTPVSIGEAVTVAIPDNNLTGISRSLSLSAPSGFIAEYIELKISLTHTYRGDVRFRLTAPSGMVSDFQRRPSDSGANYSNVVLTSVAHWGENPSGNWTLKVTDEFAADTGSLTSWSVTAYGYISQTQPSISAVSPLQIPIGAPDTVVTIFGANFIDGITTVTANGNSVNPTVTNSGLMSVTVPGFLLVSHGALTIAVSNPPLYPPNPTPATKVIEIGAAPQITAKPANQVIDEDTSTSALVVTLADTDGDPVSLSAISSNTAIISPSGIVLGGSLNNRTITITPIPDAFGGPVTITLIANDGYVSVQDTFTVTVNSVNDTPQALGGRFRVAPGAALNGTVYGFDPEGDSLTFAAVQPPASGAFNLAANGTFSYTAPLTTGIYKFTYTVSDGKVSVPATVFITVANNVNGVRPLIISEPSDEILFAPADNLNYGVIVDTSRYISPPTLTYKLVGEPAGMTISTNVVTWNATGANRHIFFAIEVRDSITGALDTQFIVLRVVAGGAIN